MEIMQRELDIKNAYLRMIKDLAFDYDGYEKAEDLKGLIDELYRLAEMALDNNTVAAIYKSENKKYNILMEEIEK